MFAFGIRPPYDSSTPSPCCGGRLNCMDVRPHFHQNRDGIQGEQIATIVELSCESCGTPFIDSEPVYHGR